MFLGSMEASGCSDYYAPPVIVLSRVLFVSSFSKTRGRRLNPAPFPIIQPDRSPSCLWCANGSTPPLRSSTVINYTPLDAKRFPHGILTACRYIPCYRAVAMHRFRLFLPLPWHTWGCRRASYRLAPRGVVSRFGGIFVGGNYHDLCWISYRNIFSMYRTTKRVLPSIDRKSVV